jgi:tetratricopeptide (TPR) repeat protein
MIPSFFTRRAAVLLLRVVLLFATLYSASQTSIREECTRALYRGEYEHAAQLAGRYLSRFPKNVGIRVLLARAELAQGKSNTALQDLQLALATDPHNIDALYYLSFTARALLDQEYQRLYSIAPNSGRVHQVLAEAALQAQNSTLAEAEFLKALAADSHLAEVNTEMAELKRSQSKFDEAIAYYTKAAENGPVNYDIAYGLGACYTYQQNYIKAIEWLRNAVAMSPDSVAGHFALGNALFQGGALEDSIPELKTTLHLEPRMKQAYFLLGRAYTKLGRKEEAAAAFKKLDALNGSEVPVQSDGGSQDPTQTSDK